MKPLFKFFGLSLPTLLLALSAAGGCSDPIAVEPPPKPVQLSSLSIAPVGDLMPAFSSAITSYETTVPSDLPSIAIEANTDNSDATITIDGLETPPGARQSVSLGPPGLSTPIEIVVSAPGGNSMMYVLNVTRIAKCTPTAGEDCCRGDYQERPCGGGNCGKQSRQCSDAGKWSAWSNCGVNAARTGQVCRAPGNPCDPVETCGGAAIDCPADYVEVPLAGRPGCWQNVMDVFSVNNDKYRGNGRLNGACSPGHGCVPSFEINAQATANHICEVNGFKVNVGITNYQQAGGGILLGYWNGSGYATIGAGHGQAMASVTCLK
jgi:hypothetical protein